MTTVVCHGWCERPVSLKTRQLCTCCYSQARRLGVLDDFPRITRRAQDVVDDTAELGALRLSGVAIAARLGLSWGGLCAAHRRAGVPVPVPKNPDTTKFIARKAR